MPRRTVVTGALVLGAFACTYDDVAPPPPPAEPAMATPADMTVFMDEVDHIDGAVRDYAAVLTNDELTPASCLAAHTTYMGTVRPATLTLISLGERIDTFVTRHDGAFSADIACATRLMMAEVDEHDHTACMWPDVERDRAEALDHVTSMVGFVDHLLERADEVLAGMAGTGWTWHPMMCR